MVGRECLIQFTSQRSNIIKKNIIAVFGANDPKINRTIIAKRKCSVPQPKKCVR